MSSNTFLARTATRNTKRKIAIAALAITALAAPTGTAFAGSGNVNLSNGCNVYWQNSYGNGQGSSYTSENSNCAQLEAKMHANLAGPTGWVTVSSGYISSSNVNVARFVDEKPAYSDHNGRKTTGGSSRGFRKAF